MLFSSCIHESHGEKVEVMSRPGGGHAKIPFCIVILPWRARSLQHEWPAVASAKTNGAQNPRAVGRSCSSRLPKPGRQRRIRSYGGRSEERPSKCVRGRLWQSWDSDRYQDATRSRRWPSSRRLAAIRSGSGAAPAARMGPSQMHAVPPHAPCRPGRFARLPS